MQECSVSSALAMETLQSSTKSLTQLVSYQRILCFAISQLFSSLFHFSFSQSYLFIYIYFFLFFIFIFLKFLIIIYWILYLLIIIIILFPFPKLNYNNYFNHFHITFSPHSLIFFPSLIVITHANVYECPTSWNLYVVYVLQGDQLDKPCFSGILK